MITDTDNGRVNALLADLRSYRVIRILAKRRTTMQPTNTNLLIGDWIQKQSKNILNRKETYSRQGWGKIYCQYIVKLFTIINIQYNILLYNK